MRPPRRLPRLGYRGHAAGSPRIRAMTGTRWQRMGCVARSAGPGLMTLMQVLLGGMPLQLPFYGAVAPILPLMSIYYWAVNRPDLMPFSVVFGVGLLHDILTAAPQIGRAHV